MSDWELTPAAPSSSNKKIKPQAQSDWSLSEPVQEESLGQSALYAAPRVGMDLLGSAYQGAQNIPDYYEKAKTEVPAFLNPLNGLKHPITRSKNVIAGLAELGHGMLNAPHGIASYLENRLNLLPKGWADKIPYQEDISGALDQFTGKEMNPGDALTRGIVRNANLLAGGNALLKSIPHLTKRGALKKLKKGQKLASERDIGTLNVDPELIKDAQQYLPNNLPERNLIEGSNYGDYDSLFRLQSDLGKISAARTGKLSKLFSPETNLKGQAGLRSRNSLLNSIHENLQALGHDDISDLLMAGQKDYRRYMQFRKYPRALGGAALAYSVPKNPLTDLVKKLWSHGGQ